MRLSSIVILFTMTFCLQGANAKSPEANPVKTPEIEKTRTPASLRSREELGKRYLQIANDLAEIRQQKADICEFDAYQSEILETLQKARSYFGQLKTTATIEKELSSSLGYRIASRMQEFENLKSGTPKFFADLVFYGRALGIYGSMEQVILGDSGKGMYKILKISENGEANWVSYPLTWSFVRNKKGSSLVFTHSSSGAAKTRSYRIVEFGTDSQFHGGLVPGNRANKIEMYDANYESINYYSMIIDECEV